MYRNHAFQVGYIFLERFIEAPVPHFKKSWIRHYNISQNKFVGVTQKKNSLCLASPLLVSVSTPWEHYYTN